MFDHCFDPCSLEFIFRYEGAKKKLIEDGFTDKNLKRLGFSESDTSWIIDGREDNKPYIVLFYNDIVFDRSGYGDVYFMKWSSRQEYNHDLQIEKEIFGKYIEMPLTRKDKTTFVKGVGNIEDLESLLRDLGVLNVPTN